MDQKPNQMSALLTVFTKKIEISSGKYRIGPFCSLFQAELIEIKNSIEFFQTYCENTIVQNRNVCIFSDSQSAISAIKQYRNSHPIVSDIKNLIISLENKFVFHFKWIKGHSGIIGNERADLLAKEASNVDLSESIYNLFPLSFAKRHFKSVTINEWEHNWKMTSKASQTKQFFPSINDRLAIKYLKPNYKLTQFLSGHGNFNAYLKRFNLITNDLCDCQQTSETPLHIIFECVLYESERHQLINAIHRSGHPLPITPKNLICDKDVNKEILNFLNTITNSDYKT